MNEPQKVGWETGGSAKEDKIEYVSLQRINDKMSASEKAGVKIWNTMVNWIRDHGGMEEKE
ncbi:hypothetical protein A3842_11205 [Paenibacillus sp. P3E]|uniref:hypothetical protein n=1 Tax=Paenibacillus sp. P3E TaxID=1349435 RepID=UPI0009391253|nr:hypothetical protein [Paenibacillus sp. P3E]OKP81638.1 hypothetical protein A3842_11205 [Paenibacillus sp. P3E]